jgi:hypothetical protein
MTYDFLYDSMLEMYRRQKISSKYLDIYAITSLAGMEFLNCLSIIVLLAYLNVASVRQLFHHSGASKITSAIIAVSLLTFNYAYWKIRAHSREPKVSSGARFPWIASGYIVGSVGVVIYSSTLVSAFTR